MIGVLNHLDPVQDLFTVPYVVEDSRDIDQRYLERIVCRYQELPWIIAETDRMIIREFNMDDINKVPALLTDTKADQVFYHADRLKSYIQNQYRLFEFGIWALELKETGQLVGKAGISQLDTMEGIQLGYQIFPPYQQKGLAREACRQILNTAVEQYDFNIIYANIAADNLPSIKLAESLGFKGTIERYSESAVDNILYVWNYSQYPDKKTGNSN